MSAARSTPLDDVCGFVDFSDRGKIELTGDDRAKFLHNLCTNDINKLATGTGCEAFLLDAKGHIQFYVLVHNTGDSLVLEELAPTGETTGARLRKHLDKYLIREKVVITDRTNDWGEVLVTCDNEIAPLEEVLGVGAPAASLANIACPALGVGAFVTRSVQAVVPNYTIFCARDGVEALQRRLSDGGAVCCAPETWHGYRIEAGLPLYGPDIGEKNLAQEIDRIERTINFRKGCYLGQETVARLDALGHVNKTLVVLDFASVAVDAVASGLELTLHGQAVGAVTSSAHSYRNKNVLGSTMALAYVKRGSNTIGTKLESAAGAAVIVGPA